MTAYDLCLNFLRLPKRGLYQLSLSRGVLSRCMPLNYFQNFSLFVGTGTFGSSNKVELVKRCLSFFVFPSYRTSVPLGFVYMVSVFW